MWSVMSRCRQCNVEIKDETHLCPLCHCVLEPGEESRNTYPDVRFRTKRLMLAGRIYLFTAILAGVLLGVINYKCYGGIWWSVIAMAALAYLYLILRFIALENAGYRVKSSVLTLCGISMIVLIDFVLGYRGWSVNYVIPGGILLIDVGIVVLMIVNARNWQSYLLFQISVILCSLVPLIFWRFQIVTDPILSIVAFGVSVFLFLGTVIIGDRRARTELKRRFHVR